jgi:predicted HTH domain antitoxin
MQLTTGTITFPEELPYSLKESKEGFMKLVLLYAAMKLFEEGKLSLGKAARLAGYSRIAFIDILSQHHISVLSYTEEALDEEIQKAQDLTRRLGHDDHC